MHPYFWGKYPIADETTDVGARTFQEKVWLSACPMSTGLDDPWINPVMDPKWPGIGCAKVLVVVAEKDVLKHRGWLYYEELRKSGWEGEVEIVETEGEEHVFYLEKPYCDKAKDLVKNCGSRNRCRVQRRCIEPDTGISARLYKPKPTNPDQKLPVLVYFHGGAFLVQTAFSPTYQPFLNSLASQANVIIVSVEYRRAPEHPLPVGYYDSWAAVKWVVSHSGGDGEEEWLRDCADFGRVFFAGDSAGANIAHNMAIRVGSDGLDGGELAGEGVAFGMPDETGLDDPWINPVMDPKWSGMGCAKVLVVVAEGDVLKHRGWLYYEELGKVGGVERWRSWRPQGKNMFSTWKSPIAIRLKIW
ncbi:hypothetical protein C3L33_20904, partial [Rhododendron williamsianum]